MALLLLFLIILQNISANDNPAWSGTGRNQVKTEQISTANHGGAGWEVGGGEAFLQAALAAFF